MKYFKYAAYVVLFFMIAGEIGRYGWEALISISAGFLSIVFFLYTLNLWAGKVDKNKTSQNNKQ